MSRSSAETGSVTAADGAAAWRTIWLVGACVALLLTLLAQTLAGPSLRQWEAGLNDLIWRHTAQLAPERRIVLVDIDERSVAEVGPWPWPRDTQARLMDRLGALGVRQQIWDVVFAGPGVPATGSAAGQGKGAAGAANQALGQSVAQQRPVLAQVFGLHHESDTAKPSVDSRPAGALPWSDCPAPFSVAGAFLGNHEAVLSASPFAAVGHITPRLAQDGVLRHQPAVVCFEGRAYPALVLAALGQSFGSQNWVLRQGGYTEAAWVLSLYPSGPPVAGRPAASQTSKPLISVPLEANGDLPIAWQRHPEAWTALSAADVLAGRVPSGMLNGAWVVVGGSAFGLNDRIATPLQSSTSGFLAHAQILSNLIDETVPVRPRAHQAAELLVACVLMALMALADWAIRRRQAPARGAGLAAPSAPVWLIPLAVVWPMVLFLGHVLLLRGGVVLGW
ncbi:MAG: CHASE2 domain-containing protein, partial [Betaproteobacteria bacterium]|nr:CHASE2 domain-containing protein [Betaproteobacteria bacterium]